MPKQTKNFTIEYRYLGRIWCTVMAAADANAAAALFQTLHPHVEIISCNPTEQGTPHETTKED